MDVGSVLKSGKKRYFPLFNIFTHDCDSAIVHFIAPKKQFKKAHQRNKVKRRLREAFHQVKLDKKLCIVVLAKNSILEAQFSDIVQQIKKFEAAL